MGVFDDIVSVGKTAFGYTPQGFLINKVTDLAGSLDPAKGYNAAAAGISGLAPEVRDFSDTQWNRQMGGLNMARGSMAPSDYAWSTMYGANNPGSMENAFNSYGIQGMATPNATAGAYGQYQDYMGQSPMTYGAMNRASGMAGSNADYSQYQNGLNGSGNANNFYNKNQGQYAQPGAGENFYAQNQQNFNRQPGTMAVYDNFSGQLYQPGRSEGYTNDWSGSNDKIGTAMSSALQAQGPTRLEGAQGDQVGNMYQNANNVNRFSRSAMPQLQGPGAYENFVTSDINGTNPALAMERQEGLASLNQEMARRGHFNSGGADVALGKFTGTMEAKDYENRAQRAQQAQQMQLGRLNQGLQTAQAGSGETMAQAQGLQGLATTQDAQRLDRSQFLTNSALSAADKNIAQQGMNMQAASQSDAARNARLNTLQGMASAGDQSWNAQQQMAGNFANQAQSDQLARLQGGEQAGQAADAGAYQRLMGQYSMGQQANDQNLARAQFQYQMGQGADATNLARYGMMGQFGNMADTQTQNEYTNYMNAANQSQTATAGRMRDAMNGRSGIDTTNAGLFNAFYGNGGQLSAQPFSDYVNMLTNSYGLQAQGGQARTNALMGLANIGLKATGA